VAVLLVDQRMPGMSGRRGLRNCPEAVPDTIRILITAYSDLSDAINAINRGQIRRYIRKPWDPDELKAVVARRHRDLPDSPQGQPARDAPDRDRAHLRAGSGAASVAHELRNPLAAMVMEWTSRKVRLDQLLGEQRPGDDVLHSRHDTLRKLRHQMDEIAAAARPDQRDHQGDGAGSSPSRRGRRGQPRGDR